MANKTDRIKEVIIRVSKEESIALGDYWKIKQQKKSNEPKRNTK